MRYTIENDLLKVEIDSHGAELKSIQDKATGREYLWNADPAYWGRTAPVLFPFTGQLAQKSFGYQGKRYPMGQHGFGRDMEHTFVSQTEAEIWFTFDSNEETLARFPLPFKLETGYKVAGRQVEVLWKVTNPGADTLYFSIGSHPAFNCPIYGEANKAGYQLYFEGFDELPYQMNNPANGLLVAEVKKLPLNNHRVTITETFFDYATYMPVNQGLHSVTLEDPDGKPVVTVNCEGSTYAIWSPERKNAPFVCIEPWYGCCDPEGFEGELCDMPYHNKLEAGKVFEGGYTMEFHAL